VYSAGHKWAPEPASPQLRHGTGRPGETLAPVSFPVADVSATFNSSTDGVERLQGVPCRLGHSGFFKRFACETLCVLACIATPIGDMQLLGVAMALLALRSGNGCSTTRLSPKDG